MAGGRDLERAFRGDLPFDVGKIRVGGGRRILYLTAAYRRELFFSAQVRDNLPQIIRRVGAHALHKRDLGGVFRGDEELYIIFLGKKGGGNGPPDAAESSVKRQLADEERGARHREVTGGRGQRDGDRQIQQRPLFGDVGGREVY